MENINWNLITNISLTVFTGIYVYLTFRLLKSAKDSSKNQERISALPLFECRIDSKKGKKILKISNISNNPAFDVDIWFYTILFDETISKKELLNKYIFKDKKNKIKKTEKVKLLEDEQYCLFERSLHANLPGKRKIEYTIEYPIECDQFEIILQYRDHIGNNYTQLYWIFNESGRFRLGFVYPKTIQKAERIELDDAESLKLKNIPEKFHYTLKRHLFGIMANHLLENNDNSVEDRWEIK